MIRHGDTFINFNKVKGTQLADIQTVMRKRPKTKFSTGLSIEAQEAMQQVVEDSKIEQNARRGKRGSKGNVLFSDTVQIRRGSTTRTLGFFDVLKESPVPPHWSSRGEGSREEMLIRGSRNVTCTVPSRNVTCTVPTTSSVSRGSGSGAGGGGGGGSLSLAVDQVEMANRPGVVTQKRKTSRTEDGKKEGRRK